MTIWQFNDYENVFCEGDHYLHAVREPFDRAGFWAVREYRPLEDAGDYLISDAAGADYEYLEALEPAPRHIASDIIRLATDNLLDYHMRYCGMDPDEADAYREYTALELEAWTRDYEVIA